MTRQRTRLHRSQKKNLRCNFCSCEFSTKIQLMCHTCEGPFKCKVTNEGMAFALHSTLKIHMKCKHDDERPFKCEHTGCLYSTERSGNLTRHMVVHSDERPFACTSAGCNFRAKLKGDMTQHKRSVHSETKAFACSKCDYKSVRKWQLKSHMHRHSSRRDFKCTQPQCKKTFKQSLYLKRHLRSRHGERNFECDQPGCGRKYTNGNSLYLHKRNVHSKKTRACSKCSYSTNHVGNFARHLIVHCDRNEKIKSSREGCDYKGKNTKAMELHVRRHKMHLPRPESTCGRYSANKKPLKDHVKLPNPLVRPVQCPLCFKHYRTIEQLQRHCFVHTKEKPFQCGHCEHARARRCDVKSHIASVHANVEFPFIVHLLDDRECLRCKVTLPSAEFVVHSKGHESSVVMI